MRVSKRNARWRYLKDYTAQRMIDEHLQWLADRGPESGLCNCPLTRFADQRARLRRRKHD